MLVKPRLSAANAARRVACPGSRALEAKIPQGEESPYTREGNAAHWVAGTVLTCGRLPQTITDLKSPEGEVITSDMIDGANLYLSSVSEIINKYPDSIIHIEETMSIASIHAECWGTPDAWIVCNDELHIWDYKYGHRFVEVFENWQLIEYAAGILEKEYATVIHFYIVQPRSFHRDGSIRKWSISRDKLEIYFERLREHEFKASFNKALCIPSPQCHHCRARHTCDALQSAVLSSIDISKSNSPHKLDAFQTGKELTYLKKAAELLDARITGLEEQTKAMITRGERVPGFKLESISNRETWTIPADEIIALGDILGCNLAKPPTTVTPSQARKLGVGDEILQGFVKRQSGSLKLIPEDIKQSHKIFGV